MSMTVDSDKWRHARNRLTPRFLTRKKDIDLRKQIVSLESLGVIERSTSSEYSQVHLARKPDDSWRLCIDFKNLNEATESLETWPLQNIPIRIDRASYQTSASVLWQDEYDVRFLPDSHRCQVTPIIYSFHHLFRPVPMVPPPNKTERSRILLSEDDGQHSSSRSVIYHRRAIP